MPSPPPRHHPSPRVVYARHVVSLDTSDHTSHDSVAKQMVLLQDRQDGNAGVLKDPGTPEKEVKKCNLRQWIPIVFFHSMCSITPVAHLKKYTLGLKLLRAKPYNITSLEVPFNLFQLQKALFDTNIQRQSKNMRVTYRLHKSHHEKNWLNDFHTAHDYISPEESNIIYRCPDFITVEKSCE